MCLSTENPASLVAGRAPNSFCLAAESENIESPRRDRASVIGIDPSIAGALAFVSRGGDVIDVADMPVLRDGRGAGSFWRSIAEAASRGEAMTVAVHLRQLRLITFAVHELVKQFGPGLQNSRAA
jgi:hypothetical protein